MIGRFNRFIALIICVLLVLTQPMMVLAEIYNDTVMVEKDSEDKAEKDSEDKTEKDLEEETEKDSEEETERDLEDKTEKVSEEETEKDLEEKTEKISEDKTEKDSEEKTEKDLEEKTEKDLEEKTEKDLEEKTEKDLEEKTEKDLEEETEKVSEDKTEVENEVEKIQKMDELRELLKSAEKITKKSERLLNIVQVSERLLVKEDVTVDELADVIGQLTSLVSESEGLINKELVDTLEIKLDLLQKIENPSDTILELIDRGKTILSKENITREELEKIILDIDGVLGQEDGLGLEDLKNKLREKLGLLEEIENPSDTILELIDGGKTILSKEDITREELEKIILDIDEVLGQEEKQELEKLKEKLKEKLELLEKIENPSEDVLSVIKNIKELLMKEDISKEELETAIYELEIILLKLPLEEELLNQELPENLKWYIENIESDEYHIKNKEELMALGDLVSGSINIIFKAIKEVESESEDRKFEVYDSEIKEAVNFSGKTIIIDNDIDLTGESWKSIGVGDNGKKVFKGNILGSGQGIIISNMTIEKNDYQPGGFIGEIDGGSVRNIFFQDITINSTNSSAKIGTVAGVVKKSSLESIKVSGKINAMGQTGGIAGSIVGSNISQISVDGEINGSTVGGISGNLDSSKLDKVEFNGLVKGNDKSELIGGLVASANGEIYNSINNGKVTVVNSSQQWTEMGGIVGKAQNLIIENTKNTGDVISSTNMGQDIGGIIGTARDSIKLKNISNEGNISGNHFMMGGIIGELSSNNLSYENLSNSGNIEGRQEDVAIGGIFGKLATVENANFKELKNHGNITNKGSFKSKAGGLVGWIQIPMNITIIDSENDGKVISTTGLNTGGLVGLIDGMRAGANIKIMDSVNKGNIEGASFVGGIVGGSASNSADFINVGNSGGVKGSNVGGLVANMSNKNTIDKSFNTGKIVSTYNGGNIGGLVGNGSNQLTLTRSYNEGDIVSDGGNIGGLVGQLISATKIKDSYNLGKVSKVGSNSGGLIGWIVNSGKDIEYNYTFNKFNVDQTPVGKLSESSSLKNNYYLASEIKMDGGVLLDSFKNNELAYLLNKGNGGWIQGEAYPILSDSNSGIYEIELVSGYENGDIKVPRYAVDGEEISLEINPAPGYLVTKISVENKSTKTLIKLIKVENTESRSFIMPNSDVEILIEFGEGDINQDININYILNGGKFLDEELEESFTVKLGTFLEKPEVDRDGFEFFGWYKEENFENEYLFNEAVMEDLEIYASWRSNGLRYVKFDLNYEVPDGIDKITIIEAPDGDLVKPLDPERTSEDESLDIEYNFKGWFTESESGELWNFDEKVENDMVLYAHWEEIDPFDKGLTEETAYVIETEETLEKLRAKVNGSSLDKGKPYEGKYFKLGADLDFADKDWEPIGKLGSPFAGNFNGNGKTISGISIKENLNDVGLFGRLESSKNTTIKNLKLEGVDISNGSNVGSLAGNVFGPYNFENIEVVGNIKVNTSTVGGVIGELAGESLNLRNVVNRIDIYNQRYNNVAGGIVGYLQSGNPILENVVNEGKIEGKNIGGLVGKKANVELRIESSYNTGELISNEGEYVGGLVGIADGGGSTGQTRGTSIENSYNTGNISAEKTEYVAGLYGRDSVNESPRLQISNSYNTGEIRTSGRVVGGLVGKSDTGRIYASYNDGSIESSGSILGGIAGEAGVNIDGVYNSGTITSTSSTVKALGGLVGEKTMNLLEASYNIGEIKAEADTNVSGTIGLGGKLGKAVFSLKNDSETLENTEEEKTLEDFKSGEVAYLMSQVRKNVWEQNLGSDQYPKFRNNGTTFDVYIFKVDIEGEGQLLDYEIGDNYYNYGIGINFKPEAKENWEFVYYKFTGWDNGKAYGEGTDLKDIKKIEYSPETNYYGLKKFKNPKLELLFLEKGIGNEFKVTFDAMGGKFSDNTDKKEVLVKIDEKSTVEKPEDPTKEMAGSNNKYKFIGWYLDEEGTKEYSFSSKVVNHLNLYAKWEAQFTETVVEFNLNTDENAESSQKPENQTIAIGGKVERPEDPTWKDSIVNGLPVTHKFKHWAREKKSTKAWNFETDLVTESMIGEDGKITLYAQWELGFAGGEIEVTGENIHLIAESVNSGNANENAIFKLVEDITIKNWDISIGSTHDKRFRGTFNGNGHEIRFESIDKPLFGFIGEGGLINDLTITGSANPSSGSFGGVVGDSYGGVVEDIKIDNLKIDGNGSKNIGGVIGVHTGQGTVILKNIEVINSLIDGGNSAESVGGIVGHLSFSDNSIIENSSIDSKTIIKSSSNKVNIGGAVGSLNFGTKSDVVLENIRSDARVEGLSSKEVKAGGIAGSSGTGSLNTGIIRSCSNTGNVVGGTVGGIIGFINSGKQILNCDNSGDLKGEVVGGIVGEIDLYTSQFELISKSKNTGNITGQGIVGGILGSYSGNATIKIEGSENEGTVTTQSKNAGGVAGYLGAYSRIEDSYNKGDITSNTGNAGGIVGSYLNPVRADIHKSYSIGNISGDWAYGIGAAKKISYSYSVGDILGKTAATVIGGDSSGAEIKSAYWYGDSTSGQYIRSFDSMNPVLDRVYVRLENSTGNTDMDDLYKSKDAFNTGEVAYLLDGEENTHENIWTQGNLSPEFGSPSFYKLVILDGEDGTITIENSDDELYVGEGQRVKITANTNSIDGKTPYLKEVIVFDLDGNEIKKISGTNYTMIEKSVKLKPVFGFKEVPEEERPEEKPNESGGGSGRDKDRDRDTKENKGKGEGTGVGGTGAGTGSTEGSGTGTGNGVGDGSVEGSGTGNGDETSKLVSEDGMKVAKGSTSANENPEYRREIKKTTEKNPIKALTSIKTDEISEEMEEETESTEESVETDTSKDDKTEELEEEETEEESTEEDKISFINKLADKIKENPLIALVAGIGFIGINILLAVFRFWGIKKKDDKEE